MLVETLATDFRKALLELSDRAMLEYAVKLTATPRQITQEDVEALREAGFDDRGILDIAQVTAYFNYVNRLALGLGVELESSWEEPEVGKTLRKPKARR